MLVLQLRDVADPPSEREIIKIPSVNVPDERVPRECAAHYHTKTDQILCEAFRMKRVGSLRRDHDISTIYPWATWAGLYTETGRLVGLCDMIMRHGKAHGPLPTRDTLWIL